MPPESGHSSPRGLGAHPPCAGATPPAHPLEPHSKLASRPPGLSVIPPFPAGICAVSHLPSPHSTGPGPPASKGASNGRRTGNPTCPSIGNGASDLRGESAEPGRALRPAYRPAEAPVPRTRSRIRTRRPGRALSRMLLGSTPRSASGPELANRGGRLIRAIDETRVYVHGNTATGILAIDDAALHRNLSTACAGLTMYESSKTSKVGVSIDRMSSGS
jgi:hypothetical protein